jgi:hypothetical protein
MRVYKKHQVHMSVVEIEAMVVPSDIQQTVSGKRQNVPLF